MLTSTLEEELLFQITQLFPQVSPVRESRFHPTRKWRFDFYWPDKKVACEVEGGTWGRGRSRHTTGSGFHKDCEKYNEAALLGITVIRVDAKHIKNGDAIQWIERALGR